MPVMHGRVALVTGSSRGLGAVIARLLARDGLAVAVNALPEPVKLNETSGGWFYLTGLLGLDGGAGLVDPHLGGQGRGCRAPAAEPVRAGGEGVV